MAKQILGKVVPIARGTYNSSTQYAILDIVEYNGSSYIAKTNVQGQAPTNTTYWQLLAKQGDKPVYKVDYLTDAEMAEIVNDIITDSTNTFNQNVTNKTTAFNNNATDKTSAFNSNATSKTSDFNSNATSKTTAFNNNAIDKTSDYNTNASSTKDDFDRNASSKTTTFNDNATSKTNSYNSNANDKTTAFNDNASAKTTAFNENASEKTTEFNANAEALQEEVDRYKTLENALPHVTGVGTTLTIEDTANSPLWLELESNTYQYATTGSQLIDFSTLHDSNTTNSFTNDVLTVSTSSGTYANAFLDITTLYKSNAGKKLRFDFSSIKYNEDPATRIVGLTVITSGTTSRVTLVETNKSISVHEIPADTSNISSVVFNIYANNTNTPTTNSLKITKPMLHFGEEEMQYEKYTGNVASPSSDYPQDIHTVTGDNTIKIIGENLIDFSTLHSANTTNSFFNNTLTISTSSGTYANAFLDITSLCKNNAGKYLRFDFTSLNSTTALSGAVGYVRLKIIELDGYVINVNLVDTSKNITSYLIPNDVSNVSSVSFVIYANNTNSAMANTLTIEKPILHFGNTQKAYLPYTEQTAELNLDNLEYCKIGDYKDRFFKNIPEDADYDALRESGKWYLKKNIGKIDSYDGETITTTYISTTGGLDTGSKIYYVLLTPTYTLLSNDIQTQLETIYNKLLGYQEQTNISQVNDDLPFNINAKAVYDLNKLVERVTTLENE